MMVMVERMVMVVRMVMMVMMVMIVMRARLVMMAYCRGFQARSTTCSLCLKSCTAFQAADSKGARWRSRTRRSRRLPRSLTSFERPCRASSWRGKVGRNNLCQM